MRKSIYCLSLADIKESEVLFSLINRCKSPVYILVSLQCYKDLRHNLIVQNYLTWMSPSDTISNIELFFEDIDEARLIENEFTVE